MARYLTPSKIGLLALISLYTDSIVPNASTIPILSFIINHILHIDPSDRPHNGESPNVYIDLLISIEDIQKATITHPSAIPGRTVWDRLLQRLWEINSLDALDQFFEDLSGLLAFAPQEEPRDAEGTVISLDEDHMRLSRTSPLGTFVRRARVEYTRLQFHDAIVLWKNFIAYRQPTLSMWRKRNPAADDMAFDVNLQTPAFSEDDLLTSIVYGSVEKDSMQGSVSTEDVQRLLEFQVDEMQKLGGRIPSSMQEQFRKVLQTDVTSPSLLYYSRFLDAWRAGDFAASFENLHRYFDYTMHNSDRTFYQYALLNMAMLQADFGCFGEAIAAMQEAVSAARENKDMACLNYCLSWLYHFYKAHPKEIRHLERANMLGVEREGLAFLKSKAHEMGLWSLWSTSLLSEAKLTMSSGGSVPAVFEDLIKCSHVIVTKGMSNAIGLHMLMQSSLWGRLGETHLAVSSCHLMLECHDNELSIEDRLKCVCRSAYLLAQRGHVDQAMAMLEGFDPEALRSLTAYQDWSTYIGVLKLQRELHRDNHVAAERLLAQLVLPEQLNDDLSVEIQLLEVDLLTRRGNLPEALGQLEDLATTLMEEDADICHRVRILTLKALLLSRCGRALKGFSIAVRAASIAWRARLLPALWHALGAVSNVLIHLKEFEAAAKVLGAIMPQASR
ncbi:MAG: anaphase promoting complex subunit 5 [Caeruleum heppii]|nr:MAG: anaphase promoting complex subunit 5 [Caeruleum heppii]